MRFSFDHWEFEDEDLDEEEQALEKGVLATKNKSTTLSSVLSTGSLIADWFNGIDSSKGGVVVPLRTKKIRFAQTCAVILIPSRTEYLNAGLYLWYFQHITHIVFLELLLFYPSCLLSLFIIES